VEGVQQHQIKSTHQLGTTPRAVVGAAIEVVVADMGEQQGYNQYQCHLYINNMTTWLKSKDSPFAVIQNSKSRFLWIDGFNAALPELNLVSGTIFEETQLFVKVLRS
jgi:hypothetical protein